MVPDCPKVLFVKGTLVIFNFIIKAGTTEDHLPAALFIHRKVAGLPGVKALRHFGQAPRSKMDVRQFLFEQGRHMAIKLQLLGPFTRLVHFGIKNILCKIERLMGARSRLPTRVVET
jgi:hypothetical protein